MGAKRVHRIEGDAEVVKMGVDPFSLLSVSIHNIKSPHPFLYAVLQTGNSEKIRVRYCSSMTWIGWGHKCLMSPLSKPEMSTVFLEA